MPEAQSVTQLVCHHEIERSLRDSRECGRFRDDDIAFKSGRVSARRAVSEVVVREPRFRDPANPNYAGWDAGRSKVVERIIEKDSTYVVRRSASKLWQPTRRGLV